MDDEKLRRQLELIERFEQLFEAAEFTQNKVQQISQRVEEYDIFDVIGRVLELQKQIQPKESSTSALRDLANAIKLFSGLLADENFRKAIDKLLNEVKGSA